MSFLLLFFAFVIGVGLSLRIIALLTKTSERILVLLLYPGLFLLGIFFGWDERIVSDLEKTGWHNFMTLIEILAGCLLFLWILQKLFTIGKTKYFS